MGSGTRPCRVLTMLGGVLCGVTTEALLGVQMGHRLALPPGLCACPLVCLSGAEAPSQGVLGAREVWAVGGLCFEVCVVGAGGYLAEQLVGLHGLYLKVAGRLKIEEFRLGRESCCSVSPATPGSGPRPSAAAGLLG